ncbi:MAG: hypothetical protein R8K47_05320 [Mariprofundaceae bacterium]
MSRRLAGLLSLLLACATPAPLAADEQKGYLYFRDVIVPAFQKLREFFDMPDRAGHYEVTMVSDAFGPLTFRVVRVREEHERPVVQRRSWHFRAHEFQQAFPNPEGRDDLIVEIANSNPLMPAKVSVYVVELPHGH